MNKHEAQSRYGKKTRERQIERSVNRNVEQRRYHKQYSNVSKEQNIYFADENESRGINCFLTQIPGNKAIKSPTEFHVKESRKETIQSTVSINYNNRNKLNDNFSPVSSDKGSTGYYESKKQTNDNISQKPGSRIKANFPLLNSANKSEYSETTTSNSFSRVQNVNLTSDESNKLSEYRDRQNFNNDSHENMNIHDLDGISVFDKGISTNQKNFLMPSITSKESIPCSEILANEVISFNDFDRYELIDLLYYKVDFMQDEQLLDYAFALRSRVLERIWEIKYPDKDELEFLCALTDGTQTKKNQKLITIRMYNIVNNIIKKAPQASNFYNSYSDDFGQQVFEQVQNPDLISRTDEELNRLPEYDEGKKVQNITVNENLNSYDIKFVSDKENSIISDFNTDSGHRKNSVNSPTISMAENAHMVEKYKKMQNVDAITSVSGDTSQYIDDTYICFGLENLLNYDVDAMHGHSLTGYSFALKERILENFYDFTDPDTEKLKFLCELTDGTQSEGNQRLITTRMCHLVDTFFEKNQNFSTGYHKHASSGKPKFPHGRSPH